MKMDRVFHLVLSAWLALFLPFLTLKYSLKYSAFIIYAVGLRSFIPRGLQAILPTLYVLRERLSITILSDCDVFLPVLLHPFAFVFYLLPFSSVFSLSYFILLRSYLFALFYINASFNKAIV